MSSKRRLRRRSCEGKVRHVSQKAALVQVGIIARHGGRVVPYHCPFCGGWHVGHPNARIKRAIRDWKGL